MKIHHWIPRRRSRVGGPSSEPASTSGDQGSRASRRAVWISIVALYASLSLGVAWGFRFTRWPWLPHWRLVANVALLLYLIDVIANVARAIGRSGWLRFNAVVAMTASAAAFVVTVLVVELDASIELPYFAAANYTFIMYFMYLCVLVFYVHAGRTLGATATWMMGTALLACFVYNWSSAYIDIYGFSSARIR